MFGEHFGEKGKSRMEEAVALKEIVLPPKPKHWVFRRVTLSNTQGATRVARPNTAAPPTSHQRRSWLHKESLD